RDRGDETPWCVDTFEVVRSAVFEAQAGPDHEVPHRGGRQHLVFASKRAHSRGDVNRDTREIVTVDLALAGMDPGPNGKARRREGGTDGECAAHRPGWSVERGQYAIAGVFDLAAPMLGDLPVHHRVVAREQVAPLGVTQ